MNHDNIIVEMEGLGAHPFRTLECSVGARSVNCTIMLRQHIICDMSYNLCRLNGCQCYSVVCEISRSDKVTEGCHY